MLCFLEAFLVRMLDTVLSFLVWASWVFVLVAYSVSFAVFFVAFFASGCWSGNCSFLKGLFWFTPWCFNHCVFYVSSIHTLVCHTWFFPFCGFHPIVLTVFLYAHSRVMNNTSHHSNEHASFLHQHIFFCLFWSCHHYFSVVLCWCFCNIFFVIVLTLDVSHWCFV